MKKVIASIVATTLVGAAGFAFAQQATTGQNQSNPRVDQQQGPVGTTPEPGRVMRNSNNNNSMSTTTTTTPSSAAGTTVDRSTERPARADRN